jgi:Tfp pilus assembly protein FimT
MKKVTETNEALQITATEAVLEAQSCTRQLCISKAVNLWCMIGTKQPALTARKYY